MGSSSQSDGRSRGRGNVKSCLRTLEVLEYFMTAGVPARTIEISEALGIPIQEQQRRNRLMQRRLQRYNVTRWASDFLAALAKVSSIAPPKRRASYGSRAND